MRSIERIPSDTPFERFFDEYFVPNVPVILTGVSATWPAATKWTRDYLLDAVRRGHLEVNKLWFAADAGFLHDDYDVPDIVRRCLAPDISHTRRNNVRVWINNRGHLTPFHSDTNGLYVFNVQLAGTKRWRVVSPDAPLDLYAFTQFPQLAYNTHLPDAVSEYVLDFRLEPHEMLFLPSFWFHQVVSETDAINLNWVGTKKTQPDNRLHRRECELLKAALALRHVRGVDRYIDLLVGTNEHDYVQNYAGTGGVDFVRALAAGVSIAAAVRRVLVELVKLPALARDAAQIRRYQESPLATLGAPAD